MLLSVKSHEWGSEHNRYNPPHPQGDKNRFTNNFANGSEEDQGEEKFQVVIAYPQFPLLPHFLGL